MAVVNVTLLTNGGRKTDVVSDTMTLKDIYGKFDVNYRSCVNTIDSEPVSVADYDKTLRELGCGSSVRLASMVKMDNALNVAVAGSAAVVRSAYKLDQWKKALKYDRDLGLYDENDDKIFAVFVEEGPGSLNENGVVFSSVPDEAGYAIATILLDPTVTDRLTVVKERLGSALISLKQLEESLDEVIKDAEEYDKEIDKMVNAI